MINYYKVGGCVRDELMGVRSKDIDYAVEAPSYEAMRDDILVNGSFIYQERPEFLSIRARHPEFGNVDFTVCRKDGFYSDARHPDTVHIGSIYDDLARRDFTVNAIAETVEGLYIDPHGGIADIKGNLLRAVGSAEERFHEDPLRILRAMRFHIVRGFKISFEVERHLDVNAYLLVSLPLERVYDELRKCFAHDTAYTLRFLQYHPGLHNIIFDIMGLGLMPVIRS